MSTPNDRFRARTSTDAVLAAAYQVGVSRRSAMKTLFAAAGAAVLFANPVRARAADATDETKQALATAQAEYEKVQAQMNELSAQFQSLSEQQDKTISQIEDVQGQIDTTQAEIDEKQAELEKKQSVLSTRVSSNYKAGDADALAMILSSTSFEDLVSKAFYVNKVNESDQKAINEVNTIQKTLEEQRTNLESQKSELETLKAAQADQLEQMKAKKTEVKKLVDGLSDEVKALIAKRDDEILESAKAEEAARQAAAAAAAARAVSSSSSSGASGVISGTSQASAGAGAQQRVVSACGSTPSPGAGYCAAWVSYVFSNAGLGSVYGNADDMYNAWCTSSDKSKLKVGMIIAVSTHPHTWAGQIYGHVGIYVGGNTVMDNIGYIRSINVDQWVNFYGGTVTPRWGWANGLNLEA